jgi:CheY-like chemotaxis protein
VKQSGGDIYVYSEAGKGTTFKIYLPRVFEPPEELKKEVPVEKIPQGNETVLVIEDDGSVRKVTVDLLRVQGYKVLEAMGGEAALIICEKEKNPIHLILTDVVMPQMNGPQVIERLMQVRQDFKALYMSGYADEAVLHHRLLERGVSIIHKPFTVEKLAKKVREVLDKN